MVAPCRYVPLTTTVGAPTRRCAQPGAYGMLLLLAACEVADGGWGDSLEPPRRGALTTRRAATHQQQRHGTHKLCAHTETKNNCSMMPS